MLVLFVYGSACGLPCMHNNQVRFREYMEGLLIVAVALVSLLAVPIKIVSVGIHEIALSII